jgi:hypothetical protein
MGFYPKQLTPDFVVNDSRSLFAGDAPGFEDIAKREALSECEAESPLLSKTRGGRTS